MSDEFQIEAVETAPESERTASPDLVEHDGAPAEPELPKTFTQEELDAALGKRVATERRRWEREQAQSAEQQRRAPTAPPQASQFTTQEAYVEALVTHKAEQLITQQKQQDRARDVDSAFDERMSVANEKYDDFDAKINEKGWYCSPVALDAIKESELGPDIAYYLASNAKESKRIFDLSPVSQIREIGKIEANLTTSPPVKKASSAPDPINPVGTRSTTPAYDTTDPRSIKTMSPSEWIAAENRRRAKQARG